MFFVIFWIFAFLFLNMVWVGVFPKTFCTFWGLLVFYAFWVHMGY